VNVPIRIVGVPEGVKSQGGVLEVVIRQVEVECLPTDIPEHLDADVTAMAIGQALTVADLPGGDRFRVLEDPAQTVCQVVVPRAEEAPAVAEAETAAAAAEPEVIKKGKEAGEGGEA